MSKQVKVLVVDDEEIVLQSVRKVLRSDDEHDFIIDTVLSPKEGLAFMNQYKYDVVITDLMMPGIDGLEFIDKAREISRESRIIMITGYATMRTALQALRKGTFDYVAKPFTKQEMLSVVKNALSAESIQQGDEARAAMRNAPHPTKNYRSFLNQTYAFTQLDNTIRFGVEPAFLDIVGEPLSVELPRLGERLTQGFPFGTITNKIMRVHNLRAPLSGLVVNINQEAVDDIDLIRRDPRGEGWLINVEPTDLEKEKEDLDS
jgi:CheY-like chemotaxis protein/glycine cleavage system H lipoate-binding protein